MSEQKTWRIPIEWSVWGYLDIEANTLDQAKEKILESDMALPVESEYIDGTLEIDDGNIEEI